MNFRNHNKVNNSSNNHLIFQTPFGYCAIVYQKAPFFIKETVLPVKDKTELNKLKKSSWGLPEVCDNAVIVSELIKDYFKGKAIEPPYQWLFMSNLTVLQQDVLKATAKIPFGETRSYKDIAVAVKRPKASRFVGNTMANNPFPIIIPCHRVIRSDRSIGQFGGGTELKIKMLEHEAHYAGLK